jgi:glucose/arabinose dehydrogenase
MRLAFAVAFVFAFAVVTINVAAVGQTVPPGFSITPVNSSLDGDAIAFALLPDGRILVAHQFSGELQLMVDGTLKAAPILTVPNINTSNEQGFLGLAVDPAWPDSNFIYTFHTTADDSNRVSRYRVNGDLSDPNSENLVVDAANPDTLISMTDIRFNHNGGTLRFGRDSTLYVSFGDDATTNEIQKLTTLHGKILRLNRDGSAPSDNPYVDSVGALPEIFAIGLRNPFRFNIDPETDELFIGDVGQSNWEEVNVATGGENFGWPRYEGNHDRLTGTTLITSDTTWPIFEYPNLSGAYSAMGLLTYRPVDFPNDDSFPPEYDGAHFFADFYNSRPVFSLRKDVYGSWVADTFATGLTQPVDAALGPDGSFYILEYGNTLSKIVYDPGPVVRLQSTFFLEGTYLGGGTMDTTLLSNGLIPFAQPYADSVYDGTILEFDKPIEVESVPHGVVDWVLADLRSTIAPGDQIARQVGFIRHDGVLLGSDKTPGIVFPMVDSTSYFVVLRHRNHASIMSSAAVNFSIGVGTWDFTSALSQAHSGGATQMADLGDGKFGMFSGDVDIDGQFTASDFNEWLIATKSVTTGYVSTDFDLDGQVLATDFNVWLVNTKAVHASQVPE